MNIIKYIDFDEVANEIEIYFEVNGEKRKYRYDQSIFETLARNMIKRNAIIDDEMFMMLRSLHFQNICKGNMKDVSIDDLIIDTEEDIDSD